MPAPTALDGTAASAQPSDSPRVAIVTGGSRGIGRRTVGRLAADGYAVVVGYAGNRDEAEAAVREAVTSGGRATAVRADVADEHAVAALFDTAEAEFGGVDVVVHAAGRMHLAPIAELDLADLDDLHRTNIRGTFVVVQQAARRVRPGGAIVTFSTSVVGLAFPGYGAYAAGKGAVEALTLILGGAGTSPPTPSRPAPRPPTCSWTGRTRRPSPAWPPSPRWSASALRPTSPRSWRSWPHRPATGSTDRSSAPTAASSEPGTRPPAHPRTHAPAHPHNRTTAQPHNRTTSSRDGSEVLSAAADRNRAGFFHRTGLDSLLTAGTSL